MRLVPLLLLAVAPLFAQESFALPSGLRVKLFENHDRPYLEARLEVAWSREDERGAMAGAGAFLGAVLESAGAGPYDQAAWRKALDDQGLVLHFEARPGKYVWSLQCPSGAQEAALEFLAHAVARVRVDGPSVEAQRALLLRESLRRSPSEGAAERFRWEVLEARPEGLLNESRLANLSLENLQGFQRRVLRPGAAMLALHGDLSSTQARQLVQLHLGVWGPRPEPGLVSGPAPAEPTGLALTQGQPEARLAVLAPEGDTAPVGLLSLLLERWIQHPAQAPAGFEGMLMETGQGPCLLLQSRGLKGVDPLLLLADLRQFAERLAAHPLNQDDLALAQRLQASAQAAAGLHPSGQLKASLRPAPPAAPVTLSALKACLARWLSPDRMRVLLLGCQALPKDSLALKGLEPISWMKSRD